MPSPAAISQTDSPASILVVEDSPTQALQLRLMLEREGFGVAVSQTAEAGLESLNGHVPDLVIADFHLPGMNGDGLIRQIRMNVRTRALPVLMLTEAHGPDLERHGLESGADAYVPKSSDSHLLLLRIRALLRTRSMPNEAEGQGGGTHAGFVTFRSARILLVEGPASDPERLGRMLDREAYEIERAGGAEAAVALLSAEGARFDGVVIDLTSDAFDGVALAARIAGLRNDAEPGAERMSFIIVGIGATESDDRALLDRAFAVGVDDLVPATGEVELASLRIRALVRRKLLQDENRRIEAELRDRELAVMAARADTAAANAKAAVADALVEANAELESAYGQLKDTQSQLVQAAKMASLGELVAGIAHEINNPLAFLLAHQQTVERLVSEIGAIEGLYPDALARVEKARQRLDAMRLGMQRIQDLVLNLRSFSRLDEGSFQTIDVARSIDAVLALLAHKLRGRIDVETRFSGDAELTCSPALFNQVIMNIIGNAADAIDGPGHISIATETDGEVFEIAVTDSGPGIPDDLRDRIFDPFFTTKPVGSGTGLGLSIAYGVVQAHRGEIFADNAPGGGARFRVRIPRRAS
jgi:two-component system NtrC family sensor kinase